MVYLSRPNGQHHLRICHHMPEVVARNPVVREGHGTILMACCILYFDSFLHLFLKNLNAMMPVLILAFLALE